MQPDIQTISLFTLNATRQAGSPTVQTNSVSSLLAASHSIEETVIQHGPDAVFFAGFQRFSAFLPQANRFRHLAGRCKKVYVFGEADSATPEIPNLEYVPLQPNAPLTREWFIIFAHPRFEIALLTREVGASATSILESKFGRGRLYQGAITLEDAVVQPASRLLHQAVGLPDPGQFPPPTDPLPPVTTYINRFSNYMENAQSQLAALYHSLAERTASLERMEGIVRSMVSRRAWDDSLQLLESPNPESDQPTRRTLTVLFTDIQGFTPLFEREDPIRLTELLNRYFNLLATIIYENHGDIDKFLGDGLMAFFENPRSAVQAALEMQRRLQIFNNQQAAHLGLELNTRIGLATGPCMIARLGSAARREVTIIGDAVNFASRLQSLAPPNGISMDEATYRIIGSPPQCIGRDVQVKGKGHQRMYSAEYETLAGIVTLKTNLSAT